MTTAYSTVPFAQLTGYAQADQWAVPCAHCAAPASLIIITEVDRLVVDEVRVCDNHVNGVNA